MKGNVTLLLLRIWHFHQLVKPSPSLFLVLLIWGIAKTVPGEKGTIYLGK